MRNLTKVTQLRSGQRDSNPSGLGLNPSLAPSSSYSPASPPPNHLHKRETLKDRTTDKEPCSHQLNNRSYTFQRHTERVTGSAVSGVTSPMEQQQLLYSLGSGNSGLPQSASQ